MPAIRKHEDRAQQCFASQTVTKNTSVLSDAYDVSSLDGSFIVQWYVDSAAGTGKAKFELMESINETDWPTATFLASGFTKSGGSSGKHLVHANSLAGLKSVKLKITETTNNENLTVSAWITGY